MIQLKTTFSSSKPDTNPYVGPRAFGHKDKLYGRDRELLELTDLLVAERIVVLHSPSGAGKTSLIQANGGLMSELRRQRFRPLPPVRVNLRSGRPAVAGRYVYSIMESLESARGAERAITSERLATLTLKEYLDLAHADPPDADDQVNPLVLILDQFEEIFTLDPTDVPGRRQFFADLGKLLAKEPLWVLFAMRDDLIGELATVSDLVPGDLSSRYRLGLLERHAALEAIVRPSESLRVTFTLEAADRILDNLCTVLVQTPGNPPLPHPSPYVEGVILQTVLLKLWQRMDPVRKERTTIDTGDLGDLLDHVDKALAGYYHDCVEEAVRRSRVPERVVRDWFEQQLITDAVWRNQTDTGPGPGSRRTERCLTALEGRHIIRSETRLGRLWWELVHDRFLRPVKDDNARWRRKRDLENIPTAAKAWADDKKPDNLLRPERIVRGVAWLQAHEDDAYPHEKEFIAESEKHAQATLEPSPTPSAVRLDPALVRAYEREISTQYLKARRAYNLSWYVSLVLFIAVLVLVAVLLWSR